MSTTATEYTRRYRAWLDAGSPDLYTLWVQTKWHEFFVLVQGYEPGAHNRFFHGISDTTAREDMNWFVLHHQHEFDDWLTTGVVPASA